MERKYANAMISAFTINANPHTVDEFMGYMIVKDDGSLYNLPRVLNILNSKGWRVIEIVARNADDKIYIIAYYGK